MKFKLLLLSFLLISAFTAFSTENIDNNTKDTLKISHTDTIDVRDTIKLAPVDITATELPPASDSVSKPSERKGEIFLWIMVGLLLVLAFIGFKIKHKEH